MNRRKEACHCRNVTYGMIEDAVRSGADTLQTVMDATGAGKGCGKCRDFLEYLIRDIREELEKEKSIAARSIGRSGKIVSAERLTSMTPA